MDAVLGLPMHKELAKRPIALFKLEKWLLQIICLGGFNVSNQ
jgi:hypothetical protein